MRQSIRMILLAGMIAVGSVLASSPAKAQGFGGYPGGFIGGPLGGGYYGGYGAYNPGFSYYGNGGHDFQPHWHTTQTPFGSFAWYGNGAHDLLPHEHTNSPYGGYRSYSPSPFGGVTTSYHTSTPYIYMPW